MAIGQSERDVVRVAAGALVDHGAYAAVQVQENSAQSTACPTRPRLPRSHGNGNEGCEVWQLRLYQMQEEVWMHTCALQCV